MKSFFFTLLFCSLMIPCFALVPMTDENLTKAVNYGISGKQDNLTLQQFLQPWSITEQLQKNPFRRRESVVVYTPYLLTAIHARDQIAEQKMPDLKEIRASVAEYEGITLIGAVLNCPMLLEAGAFHIRLLQNKKTIEPYAVTFLSGATMDIEDKTEESEGIKKDKSAASKNTALSSQAAVVKGEAPKLLSKNKTTKEMMADRKKYALLQLQFYFDQSQFIPTENYSILVSDKYCGDRRFDINPSQLQ